MKPLITTLSFSAGRGSGCLLWMVLLGDVEVDRDNFYILNADPGMENSETYAYIDMMREECRKRGFEIITVPGPNLYEDIITLKDTDKTRFDNPPYWPAKGKPLLQKCTKYYKIAPMDRAVRRILEENYGVSSVSKRIGENIVRKFIGFTYDEAKRIKPPEQKYQYFEYPLIDKGMTKHDVQKYYRDNKLPIPPRSVCNACFANGLITLADMWTNRPDDWAQAIEVDEAIRDLSQVGVREKCFVSKTRMPLKDLPTAVLPGFFDDVEDDYSCDSGFCMI